MNVKHIGEASPYEVFSATIDEEYSADEIKRAAERLNIPEDMVLRNASQRDIVDWLEDHHDELVAERGMKP